MKTVKAASAVAAVGSVLLGATTALGSATATTPSRGTINVFSAQRGFTTSSQIFVTGVVGDYGTTHSIDKNGKTDPNGHYLKVVLKKGTFEVNALALANKLANQKPTAYKSTCSGQTVASGPVTVFDGTSLYAGITGTATLTVNAAYILPRYTSGTEKGQCNDTEPIMVYTSITGSGKVSFN
jgi:hypothetical protein